MYTPKILITFASKSKPLMIWIHNSTWLVCCVSIWYLLNLFLVLSKKHRTLLFTYFLFAAYFHKMFSFSLLWVYRPTMAMTCCEWSIWKCHWQWFAANNKDTNNINNTGIHLPNKLVAILFVNRSSTTGSSPILPQKLIPCLSRKLHSLINVSTIV